MVFTEATYMSVHVVVLPALECRALIIGVLAIDFDQLVEDTSRTTNIFVAEMVSKDEEDLCDIRQLFSTAYFPSLTSLIPSLYW